MPGSVVRKKKKILSWTKLISRVTNSSHFAQGNLHFKTESPMSHELSQSQENWASSSVYLLVNPEWIISPLWNSISPTAKWFKKKKKPKNLICVLARRTKETTFQSTLFHVYKPFVTWWEDIHTAAQPSNNLRVLVICLCYKNSINNSISERCCCPLFPKGLCELPKVRGTQKTHIPGKVNQKRWLGGAPYLKNVSKEDSFYISLAKQGSH